ncbi:MAG: DUF4440 domain-containing protein [Alphaproteobacteria bacterium]|nr:DUF4440 domain-containing protein [Alphaproteobacteria bacterium]MBU1514793.1 DUF4440 domain-containing protein [Alphaproteobacteria bacterium]MBU2093924.1 DUF4440 domain-containing protein [Alphaproteobacteria bacterium]MBU2153351.1 DUF4440 domain-containing protein [Alphaproteobacteria bacterium]MBU2309779.1 DUF4440 domain-containing protein [Alphaproteobacteria bacterium]
MSKTTLAACAAIALTLAACSKPAEPAKPAVDLAKIEADVKADMFAVVDAVNARDAEKAVSHDAPNFVGMFHGGPNTNGPAEELALTKQQLNDPNVKLEVSNPVVDVAASGDMAVWRSGYAFTFTDPKTKAAVVENGNWVTVYRVQPDGAWKQSLAVVSDTGPAKPAAPAT